MAEPLMARSLVAKSPLCLLFARYLPAINLVLIFVLFSFYFPGFLSRRLSRPGPVRSQRR